MIVLLPNFGAEEGDEGAVAHRPDLQTAALLWRELFAADARLLGVEAPPRRFGPAPAFSWLPPAGGVPWLSTVRAARRLARRGLPLAAPDPAVVEVVHDKAFALRAARRLGLAPPGEAPLILEPDALDDLADRIARLPPGPWVVKPRRGSSGRGRVPVQGGRPPRLGRAFERLRRLGGAIVEPWHDRICDLSVQLHVGAAVELLGSTRQILLPGGAYVGNRCVLDDTGRPRAGTRWDDELEAAGIAIAEAARAAGFSGPCGVDAYVHRAAGAEVLRPVVELNARYTMGTVALGILRRLQEAGAAEGAAVYVFSLRDRPADGARRFDLPGGAVALLGGADAAI